MSLWCTYPLPGRVNESHTIRVISKWLYKRSSGKGVMASGAEQSSDRSSEGSDSVLELEEVFPSEAEK
ncbi:hypothetical protein Tco_1391725 [Tanacetum coccineum]